MNANSIAICGTNTTTPPIPASTPSTMRSRIAPSGSTPATQSARPSMAAEIRSIAGAASQKMELNSASITAAKKNVPQSRCVRSRSIWSSGSRGRVASS